MRYLFGIILLTSILSCKKQLGPQPAASLNVINVTVSSGSVEVNYLGSPVTYAGYPHINYGANAVYTIGAGNPLITIVPTADTLHPIFNNTIATQSSGIYSLYLIGQAPNYDTLLRQDTIPYRTDSSAGIRFANLSPNSSPVTINLSGTPGTAEFSSIGYKQIAAFKTYPAKSTNKTYKFEVRDATTSVLLTSYSLTTPTFQNVTLVFKGLVGGSGSSAVGVIRVNNY